MSFSFIFPGQGSQFVGMGQDLFDNFSEAKEVFQEVDEVLNQKLSTLMFSGEDADLNMTENTQPALMAVSMAVMRVLEKQGGLNLQEYCSYVAGHSLGEYSALTAAGALKLSDTAKLLKLRGQSMQKAVPAGQGSMAAILGLDFSDVKSIADEATNGAEAGQVCEAANDNSVGQVVLSGNKSAVELAVQLATDKGAKRAVILPVSAPFHCSLMQPAADVMKEALSNAQVLAPVVPVVSNVTAQAETDPDKIRELLVSQITGMVRWRESVQWMSDNQVTDMVELGAGKVLNGLVRRINKDIKCEAVGSVEQIEKFIQSIA